MRLFKLKSISHKPGFPGLCLSFLFSFLFVGVFSLTFVGCKTGVDEPTLAKKDTVKTDSGAVVILKPSDVKDYNKYYKPQEMKNMDVLRSDSKWSFVRSKQSEHFFVFWEAGFGSDPNASTVPEAMRIDVDDMLKKEEEYYAVNVNTLKFAEVGKGKSNLDKYKMQIYLLYQTEWAAYGGGYDNVIGGLWVNPATCKPVGSVIAHEIGHSFQYQVYADAIASGSPDDLTTGFRYGFGGNGGNAFWEQTAQWQSYQSYPTQAFDSYNFSVYTDNYHRHICHEWQRYASYFIHYYWAQKRGIDFIGRIWRESKSPEDPIQTYMRLNNLTVDQLNAEMYEAATRFVTWDLDAIRSNGANYIGKHTYKFYQLTDGTYQVAYARCPGTTGYNVIPLNVPAAGTVVSTAFTALTPGSALAPGDPGQYSEEGKTLTTTKYNSTSLTRAGWRYGYVALLSNGQRVYSDMNRKTSANVEFTVPAGCVKLWFVVLGAPSSYLPSAWDEKESNDDQWPYTVKFTNTDLLGNITINPNDTPKDLTLTYNLSFAADAAAYSGTTVNLNTNGDIAKVAQALVLQPSAIAGALLNAKATPQEGKIAFAAVESNGSLNYNTTANGLGFWFDSSGNVTSWGKDNDSRLFNEFASNNFEFTIGQYPGKSKAGDKYTVKEAFVYTKNSKQYQVTFVFNVTIK
ncbi:DUF4859 domain-containing protein [Parabacteroides sp. FAFU027]|uniref:DUF4859 domain-containing protein n=1 Tax=Parabacteroides sp. FAFU027 TaxID=2922715 RepID=UPI001FAE94A5|nr:DUF4859 domain-containing protein [Parabacteroides sp. FAFU027]